MKSANAQEPPLAILLKPFKWTARSISWLTSMSAGGGARYVFMGVATLCAVMSAETVYTAMPASQSAIRNGVENRHFLPKPAINDEADISLLNPLPRLWDGVKIGYNQTLARLPFAQKMPMTARWTVWADGAWYLAILITLAIQGIEAIGWRTGRRAWDSKMAKFQKLNSRKLPDMNPQAILAAKVARAELATEGTGGYVAMALTIIAVYGVEFFAFTRSVAGVGVPGLTIFIYALINIFGFELCDSFANSIDDEDESKKVGG
jgi:hypothetical protein